VAKSGRDVAANKNVEHHSHVNGYLTRSYAQMQAVGIRRQWDHKERRPTIGRLLDEIARHPESATRARFVQMLDSPREDHAGWRVFSPNDAEQIDPDIVASDLHRIVDETAGARDYVNRMVAHIGNDHTTRPIGSGDWFGDIDKGIDVLAETIKKYWSLFHPGNMLASVTPLLDLNWIRMFQTAWYSEDFVPMELDVGELR
jgi:hypothetical protein